jgi:hypothetical protein
MSEGGHLELSLMSRSRINPRSVPPSTCVQLRCVCVLWLETDCAVFYLMHVAHFEMSICKLRVSHYLPEVDILCDT